jgi:glycosyltransferase involved in cell wall biosynthesis
VDLEITPLSEEDAVCEVSRRFRVNEPFILFCGCAEAKKNLNAAVWASNEAGLLLLVVGPRIHGSSKLRTVETHAPDARCRYLGYVSTSDLSALYSAARTLILPSYVEGFGLPAIEAMRCGCPVIASNAQALLEVCGGAAVHVPPRDTPTLAAAVLAVATDHAFRESLAARGKARAAKFNWEASVDHFRDALHYAERSSP